MIEKYGTDLSTIEATDDQLDEIKDMLEKTGAELPSGPMTYKEAMDYLLKSKE